MQQQQQKTTPASTQRRTPYIFTCRRYLARASQSSQPCCDSRCHAACTLCLCACKCVGALHSKYTRIDSHNGSRSRARTRSATTIRTSCSTLHTIRRPWQQQTRREHRHSPTTSTTTTIIVVVITRPLPMPLPTRMRRAAGRESRVGESRERIHPGWRVRCAMLFTCQGHRHHHQTRCRCRLCRHNYAHPEPFDVCHASRVVRAHPTAVAAAARLKRSGDMCAIRARHALCVACSVFPDRFKSTVDMRCLRVSPAPPQSAESTQRERRVCCGDGTRARTAAAELRIEHHNNSFSVAGFGSTQRNAPPTLAHHSHLEHTHMIRETVFDADFWQQ